MRLFALMPTKNEAGRYLAANLVWHQSIFDVIFVFDDRSDDGTPHLAEALGAQVMVRPDGVPSFLEHEGRFRQAAWDALIEGYNLNEDDWVMAIDADEFLVCEQPYGLEMFNTAVKAQQSGHLSVQIPVPEVFDQTPEGVPLIRTDGFWPNQHSARFVRFQPDGKYRDAEMASGQVPAYAMQNSAPKNHDLAILHYGYCDLADRIAKYERYSAIQTGHNPAHIASILETPTLEQWTGTVPIVWRGQ